MKIIKTTNQDYSVEVANIIEKKINSIKKEHIVFGLCGGRSVSNILKELLKRKINWQKVHFFFVDERITKNKDELNFTLINTDFFIPLLEKRKIKELNIHNFKQSGNLEKDIFSYGMDLTRLSFRFDIALLSSGEDGHIASLFPNHPSIKQSGMGYIHVSNSPKPPLERISVSRNFIAETDTAILMFLGEGKKEALNKFKDKKKNVESCPAKIIQNIKDSYVITDLN